MVDVHGVDLLERAILGLDDEKVGDEEQSTSTAAEHETVKVVNLIRDESSEEGDEEVEEPVGGGSQCDASRAVTGWVQLRSNGPDNWSPGSGEGGDEEAGESDHDLSGCRGGFRIIAAKGVLADEGEDEETHSHPGGAGHESWATTEGLDDPETGDGTGNVDRTKNDRCDIRVFDTSSQEDGSTVVKEEIGAGQLLSSLQDHAEDCTVGHAWTSEHFVPLGPTGQALLVKLLLDFLDLIVDERGVLVDTVEAGHGTASFIMASHTVCPARRLGENENSSSEDECPEEGNPGGDAPLSRVVGTVVLVGTVVDLLWN